MALENIRKWKWINQMNEKINRMWKYDMLTQVFNRSGFFYSANAVVERIKGQHRRAFMIFLDIDGLNTRDGRCDKGISSEGLSGNALWR